MTTLIYSACDGKMSDIKALEQSNYWDFCAFLDSYLKRVDQHNESIEKMMRENKIPGQKRRK
jgi:hypothetical protein